MALIFARELCNHGFHSLDGSFCGIFLCGVECGKLLLNTVFPEGVLEQVTIKLSPLIRDQLGRYTHSAYYLFP